MSSEFFKNSDDSRILMEFFKNFDQNTGGKLQWQIHQLILKHFDQNSTCKSFLKNYDVICFCLVQEKLINFRGICHQNSSKNQMTVEFFQDFDQNTSGKLQWQIHQMILEFLKHFDQNSVWKCCCLFFDQNSSRKKIF